MTWFTATSVTVTNGQSVVSVNAGDDIQLAQEAGGLIIGSNPPVEIKRSYLDGSNNKKIELRSPWPYGNQTAQAAVAFPTDGDLAAATAVLKQLIDGFTLATQVQAEQGSNNTATMTALRVKQAIDFFRPMTISATDTTAGRVWRTNDLVKTASPTDTTAGRMLKVGDFGIGSTTAASLNNDVISSYLNLPSGIFRSNELISGIPNANAFIALKWNNVNAMAKIYAGVAGTENKAWIQTGNNVPSEIYHRTNILGTVSQASGVPTGAIIQRGSNSNGEFVRFADGTQICTTEFSNITSNVAEGSLFKTALTNWTFPVVFFGAFPFVSFNANNNSIWFSANMNASVASFIGYSVSSLSNVATIRSFAIGRWF